MAVITCVIHESKVCIADFFRRYHIIELVVDYRIFIKGTYGLHMLEKESSWFILFVQKYDEINLMYLGRLLKYAD